jgi:Zn-dependent M28 family amino/carboxypeptidase
VIRMKPVFESGKVQAPNVVAVLPGSDPNLKGEYVLLSAHLDHIGLGEPINGDNIYNGAMDNASGVATLLEAARLLRASAPPKRSILFLACTGEEEFEKGSLYYAEKPTVEAKNIIANINLDMYLPLFPLKILRAYGLRESDLAGYLEAAAKENGIEVQDDPTPERNIFIRSDQYSFIKKGIPALFLSFGYNAGTPEEKIVSQWFEQRYHGPTDDTKQPVDKMAAAKFNQLMATLAERLANASQRPQWKADSFFRRFVK